jgi:hypothetical protein
VVKMVCLMVNGVWCQFQQYFSFIDGGN